MKNPTTLPLWFYRLLLLLPGLFFIFPAPDQQLNVALYPFLPNGERFQQVLDSAWKAQGNKKSLRFVYYDCYQAPSPNSLDVFVFDAIYAQESKTKGLLKELDFAIDEDFMPYAQPSARQTLGTNYPTAAAAWVRWSKKVKPGAKIPYFPHPKFRIFPDAQQPVCMLALYQKITANYSFNRLISDVTLL